jgi:hypothetical protein
MNKYILLLHQGENFFPPDISPEEIQAIIGRYKAWGQKLREAGRYVASDKLEDGTARVMRGEGDKARITDGPFAETKDVIGGYYMIQAESYDDAVHWAKDCPHLAFGSIEVRKVDVV